MNKKVFNYYADLATKKLTYTEISGRYKFQHKKNKIIAKDILNKLNLKKKDTVLEIGSGPGLLANDLLAYCKEYTAIDNKNVLNLIKNKKIKKINCNFFNYKSKKKFNKIIIYSVLHCLTNYNDVYKFINKAINLIKPGGSLLIGDIPNEDKKKRFLKSNYGKKFKINWNKVSKKAFKQFKFSTIKFSDKIILNIINNYRKKGYEVFVLSQNEKLPFSNTREDLIIWTHK